MIVNATKLLPTNAPGNWYHRIYQSPFVRLILYLLIILVSILLSQFLFNLVIDNLEGNPRTIAKYGLEVFQFLMLFFVYKFIIRKTERRSVFELSKSNFAIEIGLGFFMGLALIAGVVIILAISGSFSIQKFNSINAFISGFFEFGFGAFFEELIFRLILFKLLEEYFGTWISLIFTALLFGAAHLFNENATLWSAFAIATEAGVLLCIAFIFTRRIWLAFGLHFGWNFMQASVFGLPTSGITFDGLMTSSLTGPVWLTGGEFGIEASPISIILGLLLSYFLIKKALKDDQIILPAWRNNRKPEIRY